MGTLMSFSSCATSHCCLFDFQPITGIWITRGSVSYPCREKKGDLVYLKEHAGLRGLFPQRGGYESECHSDSAHSHTTSASACCQGAPALTSPPLPFLAFIALSLAFSLLLFLHLTHILHPTISSHSLPSSPAGYIAALQGMENCVLWRMVVIPITPQMQRGSSKVQNNWQVPAATDSHSILVLYVCECVRVAVMRGSCCRCSIQRSFH